jgi:methyltransferase (TIGR00027 family)
MTMPDLSNSMYVARLRYIQSVHEFDGCRNPDWLVHRFFSPLERLKTAWMRPSALSKLRSDPFYYYLIARTMYYDVVFQEAIDRDVRRIIGVGCGSDTRAFRFSDLLQKNGVSVLECDQQESVIAKQRIVRRWDDSDHVDFMSIDLNDGRWPALERTLDNPDRAKTLVIMEGVSPYVDFHCFVQFLALLGRRLASGSLLAYDFKLSGVDDEFGLSNRTERPFRLPWVVEEITSLHEPMGFKLERMELSSNLSIRMLSTSSCLATSRFKEDGLLLLVRV